MDKKELYRQKIQAQIDAWKADFEKIKAQFSGQSADAQLKMKDHMEKMEKLIEDGNQKLAEIEKAGEEKWESVKEATEKSWENIKSSFSEVLNKFKK